MCYKLIKVFGIIAIVLAIGVGIGLQWVRQPLPPITEEEVERHGGHALKLKDGRIMEYFEFGSKEGQPVVFMHGGLMCGKLGGLFGKAKEFGFRVIAPSIPGWGLSDFKEDLALKDYPKDIEQLLDHLHITTFYLAGASLGTLYVAAIVAHLPDRVLKISIGAPSAPPPLPVFGFEGWGDFFTLNAMLMPIIPEFLAVAMQYQITTDTKAFAQTLPHFSEVQEPFATAYLENLKHSVSRQCKALTGLYKLLNSPWGVDLDILYKAGKKVHILIKSEEDLLVYSSQVKFAQSIAGSEVQTIPGSHMSTLNNLDLILSKLK